MSDPIFTADHSYALGRLSRAVQTLQTHADAEVRARAQEKIDRWNTFLEGMASGKLSIGSRTPVKNTPAWVTLEVAHGGFATGRYLAEGPLGDDERALLETIPTDVPGSTERERLNLMFLSDPGQARLLDALETGRYTVDVPEHGALLVATWLFARGYEESALDLITALRPLMHRLRFYPRFEKTPHPGGSVVRVATVSEVQEPLSQAMPNPRIEAMKESLTVWIPLYERLVALWLSTVDGEAPSLDDARQVQGGWPCKRWPSDFPARRRAWMADYAAAQKKHKLCGKHQNPKSNFYRLQSALQKCATDSRKLSGREVGQVRRALANTVAKHGLPGAPARVALREAQIKQSELPSYGRLAHLLAERLSKYDAKGGVPSLEPFAAPVSASETEFAHEGCEIPEHLTMKVARALEAPIQALIDRGIISSAEVLAKVLPQITAQVAAAGIEEASLRALFGRIYAAFRSRRSLLLLNLEHQVQLDELPWIAALAPLRKDNLNAKKRAEYTLTEATHLSLAAFPQTILPNPMVRELSALSKSSALKIPLVEEVAADIFMGTFTTKWQASAQKTSQLMAGTLYARYYDLPEPSSFSGPESLLAKVKKRWGAQTAEGFAQLCQRRAKEAQHGSGSFVAQNGTVIEQSQILTTHNLAPLVDALGLRKTIEHLAPSLVEESFQWILRRHSQPVGHFRAKLQMVKNTAYAWRQAIFFLSFLPHKRQGDLIDQLELLSLEAKTRNAAGIEKAIAGLRGVYEGARFDSKGYLGKGRRFLGWSVGPHWMLA